MRRVVAFGLVVTLLGCGRRAFETEDAPSADAGVVANRVFVTSTTHLPMTFGADLSGADAICAARASAANLTGTYRAWLSTATTYARDRLNGSRGWVRVDGRPVADRVEDLLAGRMYYPIRTDERGEDVGISGPWVATATAYDGVAGPDCMAYTNPADLIRVGRAWGTINDWTHATEIPCTNAMRIYCFGTDLNVPLAVTAAAGRYAFVSVQPFAVTGGFDAADTHCRAEAALGGLPGTYAALLAGTSATAASRFDLSGAPWVRLDGAQLATTPLGFMSGSLLTPLAIDQLGQPRETYVLTGAGNPLVSSNETCGDWTLTSTTTTIGNTRSTDSTYFFSTTNGPCADPLPLYCLQL